MNVLTYHRTNPDNPPPPRRTEPAIEDFKGRSVRRTDVPVGVGPTAGAGGGGGNKEYPNIPLCSPSPRARTPLLRPSSQCAYLGQTDGVTPDQADDDQVPPGVVLDLDEAFVSSRPLRTHGSHFVRRRSRWDSRTSWRRSSAYSTVGSDLTKEAFNDDSNALLPAEAARRLGVPTRVVIQAMYEKMLPRVRLEDGTLGIPADALEDFEVSAS